MLNVYFPQLGIEEVEYIGGAILYVIYLEVGDFFAKRLLFRDVKKRVDKEIKKGEIPKKYRTQVERAYENSKDKPFPFDLIYLERESKKWNEDFD